MPWPWDYLILCLAAAAGGAINAVAGGGTLLTFPALFAVLSAISPAAAVLANGTSTLALLPGSIAALGGYREELRETGRWARILILPSLLGGVIGSLLVTQLPPEWFETAIPWLILTAALLFALQPVISRWTGIGQPHSAPQASTAIGVFCFQFLVAIYGGYFGAGIGILMLSALAFLGFSDIHQMNALKSLLGSAINLTTAIVFVVEGKIVWSYAIAMAIAAMLGAYGAARVARKLDRRLVRSVVTAIGFVLAAWFFYREFVLLR